MTIFKHTGKNIWWIQLQQIKIDILSSSNDTINDSTSNSMYLLTTVIANSHYHHMEELGDNSKDGHGETLFYIYFCNVI